jgi:tetratricopeptide (TPR) repeat protein
MPGNDATDSVYDNYRRNLSDICGVARRARAALVLSTVAVNLRDCPPLGSLHRSDLTPEDLARWESIYKAAGELQAGNRSQEALEQYEAAAKIDDRFAELQFRIGECLMRAGRFAGAREQFELARDLDVLRFRADSRINAIIREVAGEQEAAGVRLVDAEAALAQSDPDSQGIAGGDLFYEHVHLTFEGNYALARAVLEQVCAALPQLAAAGKHGATASRQRCAELLALTPWDEYRSAGKMVEMTSRAPFTNQLDHSVRQAAARRRRDDLRRLASTPQALQAAWKTYEAALATSPDDWSLHYHFGELAMRRGRPSVAVEQLRIATQSAPWDVSMQDSLGDALAAQGQVDEAIAHYHKALELKPDCPETHNKLGMVLASRGQVDAAIAEFEKALEIDPDYAEACYNLGRALAGRGQFDGAIARYRKALEIEPDYAEAHNNLGFMLVGRGQFGEAIAHCRKALEIDPDYAEAHYNLGRALAGSGLFDEAIAQYRTALKINPDYAEAHHDLGLVLCQTGQVREGTAHFQRALEIKPDYAEAHNSLGIVLESRGQVDEAIAHFRKAVEIKPDYAEAHNNLGFMLAGRGLFDEAIAHYEKALELRPGYIKARRGLEATRMKRP